MLKLTPIFLTVLYGLVMYRFSAWATKRSLDQQSSELADANLRTMTDRLAIAAEIPSIRVHIYEVQAVNGLASPDGRLFITRGFYDQYIQGKVTAEEIASVIAHELGHVALGHTRRRIIDFSGQNAMRTALAMMLSRIIPGLGVVVAGLLTSLLAARLSRADEFEADAYATALLIKAGIGAGPQKSLLGKLDQMSNAHAAGTPAWLLSHPKPERRIAAIERNEEKWR